MDFGFCAGPSAGSIKEPLKARENILDQGKKEKIKRFLRDYHGGAALALYRYFRDSYHNLKPTRTVFTEIYRKNDWNDPESVSGTGSNVAATSIVRDEVARLIEDLRVKTLIDAPCGDFNWMRLTNLKGVSYLGVDVVPQLIDHNNNRYGQDNIRFQVLDVVKDVLPRADLILCRDALVHFFFKDVLRTLRNFKKSGAPYLLTTTFPKHQNVDIKARGRWRPLNLQIAPFNLPSPVRLINEGCTEMGGVFSDKSLGLWALDEFNC